MCSGPRLPRRRCGGWSMNGSTPRICQGSRRAGGGSGRRPGLPAPPPTGGNRSTSMSTPRWSSTIPTTSRMRHRPGRVVRPPPAAGVSGPPRSRQRRGLAGLLRKGNAGSNTAADHITVLTRRWLRYPRTGAPTRMPTTDRRWWCAPDSAGATHRFAQACRDRGLGSPFGFPSMRAGLGCRGHLNLAEGWYPAIDAGGGLRDGAWVASHALVNLATWPAGTRLVLRKERPTRGRSLPVHRH